LKLRNARTNQDINLHFLDFFGGEGRRKAYERKDRSLRGEEKHKKLKESASAGTQYHAGSNPSSVIRTSPSITERYDKGTGLVGINSPSQWRDDASMDPYIPRPLNFSK